MRSSALFAALLPFLATTAAADPPYTPSSDSVVLERVAVPRLPGTATLSELRESWAVQPKSVPAALAYARAGVELNRREEDPRYLGYAEAALRPWWDRINAPPEVALLRASLRLARLDYAAAEIDLQALIDSSAPEAQAARLTRATLRLSQGDPQAARRDCEAASAHVSPLVAATCISAARGLAGDANGALASLEEAIAAADGVTLGVDIAAHSVAAELALRLGKRDAAQRHFEHALRRMRAAQTTDPGLLASYADFLLDQGDNASVRALLAPYPRQDTLLLRLAMAMNAARRAGDSAGATSVDEYVARLAQRFREMRERNDGTHLREQALFELELRDNPAGALELMKQSWVKLREPIDARIYLRAARAAQQPDAARPVLEWLQQTKLDDVRLASALVALNEPPPSR